MGIHLVRAEHRDTSDEQEADPAELSRFTYRGNARMGTNFVLVDGRYEAIHYLDDGDGPLLEDD